MTRRECNTTVEFRLAVSMTVTVRAGTRKNRKAKRLQIFAKAFDGFKDYPANSHRACCLDVFVAVIDEERFRWRNFQQGEGMPVDDGVGLYDAHLARENPVIEVAQPGEVLPHVGGHIRLHV